MNRSVYQAINQPTVGFTAVGGFQIASVYAPHPIPPEGNQSNTMKVGKKRDGSNHSCTDRLPQRNAPVNNRYNTNVKKKKKEV